MRSSVRTNAARPVGSGVAALLIAALAATAIPAVAGSVFASARMAPAPAGTHAAPPADGEQEQDHVNARPTRPVRLTPRIGPPGTQVSLIVASMPAMTPVQLALGATGTGFEALALGYTTIDGDLQESVVVPEWSKPEETHRFIVFNLYFTAILAESAIFHVTDADGAVRRTGTVVQAGPGCLALEDADGERYRLTGATSALTAGEELSLQGTLTESTAGCGEGLSLDLHLRSLADVRR